MKAEYGPEFYQTRGDAESVAEFIRVYRNRFDANDAPLVLAGESYGVTRAAGVADVLERRGTRVSGTILIGLALPLGIAERGPAHGAERADVHRNGVCQQEARWRPASGSAIDASQGRSVGVDAICCRRWHAAMRSSDAERSEVIADLARFTGFDASLIDRKTLAIPMPLFSEQLLRAENRIVGRYDSRLTAPFDPAAGQDVRPDEGSQPVRT